MKRGMEPFLVLNRTISSKSVVFLIILQVSVCGSGPSFNVILVTLNFDGPHSKFC